MRLGIVGITGLVGQKIIESLKLLNIRYTHLGLYASQSSKGKIFKIGNEEHVIDVFSMENINHYDYLILAVENDIAKNIIEYKKLYKFKTIIIDNSSEYRLDKDVPLIVPEINSHLISTSEIIANPNCSTTMLVMLLAPLKGLAKFKKINVSTYQAASGAGIAGLNELRLQTKEVVEGAREDELTTTFWKKQYIFNVFSHNSKITQNFYNQEEMKMINETRKILNLDKLIINPTCIRVPTLTSHCLSINVEFQTPVEFHTILDNLKMFPGLKVEDDHSNNSFPEPIKTTNTTDIMVGRIRPELDEDGMFNYKSWNFFISGDQLLKGAAYNSVQILDRLINL
jgi:aspartate-semialdehyde dehydrogenase